MNHTDYNPILECQSFTEINFARNMTGMVIFKFLFTNLVYKIGLFHKITVGSSNCKLNASISSVKYPLLRILQYTYYTQ